MVKVDQSKLSDWEKLEGEFTNALFIVDILFKFWIISSYLHLVIEKHKEEKLGWLKTDW